MSYVKIGVGGPVGSGKTALIERLTRKMSEKYSICVVTNDIYTKEDAEFLIKNSALPAERIIGVETGGCPHTAIREDCSMNLEAVEEMARKFPDVEIIFIESGGSCGCVDLRDRCCAGRKNSAEGRTGGYEIRSAGDQ